MNIKVKNLTPSVSTLEFAKFNDGFKTSLVVRGWA